MPKQPIISLYFRPYWNYACATHIHYFHLFQQNYIMDRLDDIQGFTKFCSDIASYINMFAKKFWFFSPVEPMFHTQTRWSLRLKSEHKSKTEMPGLGSFKVCRNFRVFGVLVNNMSCMLGPKNKIDKILCFERAIKTSLKEAWGSTACW